MGVTYDALESNSQEYKKIHKELYLTYGLAAEWDCEYWDNPAKDWSWIHGTNPLDIENYSPLCRSCHRFEDFTDEWRSKIGEGAIGNQHAKGPHVFRS